MISIQIFYNINVFQIYKIFLLLLFRIYLFMKNVILNLFFFLCVCVCLQAFYEFLVWLRWIKWDCRKVNKTWLEKTNRMTEKYILTLRQWKILTCAFAHFVEIFTTNTLFLLMSILIIFLKFFYFFYNLKEKQNVLSMILWIDF